MNNTTNKTIADYAISYKMGVATFNPTATVKEVRQATAQQFGCRENQTTGTVYLVLKEYTQPLTEIVREIRKFFDFNTLKLGDIDLIPSKNFWRVSDFVRVRIPVFDAAAKDFCDHWEQEIKPNSIKAMSQLGVILTSKQTKVYQMTKDDVRERIYFRFTKTPIGSSFTLSNMEGLTEDLRASFTEELEKTHAEIQKKASEELASRFSSVLKDFSTKMKSFKEDGGSRIHPSILSNIGDLVDLLPGMLVGSDKDNELIELATEAKAVLNWDVDILRENPAARKVAAQSADSILQKMKLF